MKKLTALALALCLSVSAFTFAGCAKKDDEDKGAMIRMYLTSFPNNLDPTAVSYGSTENARMFGLLYEGLFNLDEKGKLEKVLADEWEYYVDARDDTLKLEITLVKSNWSDGIPVDADDFVYAWQRLLKPTTENAAAALLYPIKNAKAVKEGRMSVNDLGLYAIKDNVLQIAFEKDFTNIEYFLRRLASPALVPLREDNASKFDDENNIDYLWDASTTLAFPLSNGPFKYRKFTGETFELERNIHYRNLSANEDAPVDKIVKPYQLITIYKEGKTDLGDAASHMALYTSKETDRNFYLNLSEASAEDIAAAGKTTETALPSMYTYFFDTTNELFADARVRKALYMALDKNEIAKMTGRKGTYAAKGFVPDNTEYTVEKTDFRKSVGNVLNAAADMEGAKALLKEAGVSKGSITLEYNKDRAYEKAIADYVKGVWKELGFKVDVSGKPAKYITNFATGSTQLADGKSAHVIGMDFMCTTPDAYGVLISFSKKYSGGKIDLDSREVAFATTGITGYASDAYDAICDKMVSALNNDARAEAEKEAELFLAEEMPVLPLFGNVAVTAVSGDLSGLEYDDFGRVNFTKTTQKNYAKYLPEETEHVEIVVEEDAEAAEETTEDAEAAE